MCCAEVELMGWNFITLNLKLSSENNYVWNFDFWIYHLIAGKYKKSSVITIFKALVAGNEVITFYLVRGVKYAEVGKRFRFAKNEVQKFTSIFSSDGPWTCSYAWTGKTEISSNLTLTQTKRRWAFLWACATCKSVISADPKVFMTLKCQSLPFPGFALSVDSMGHRIRCLTFW